MNNKIKFLVLGFAFLSLFSCKKSSKETEVDKLWNVENILNDKVEPKTVTWSSTNAQEIKNPFSPSLMFVAENEADVLDSESLLTASYKFYKQNKDGIWELIFETGFDESSIVYINDQGEESALDGNTDVDNIPKTLLVYSRNIKILDWANRITTFADGEKKMQKNFKIWINDLNFDSEFNMMETMLLSGSSRFKHELTYTKKDGKKAEAVVIWYYTLPVSILPFYKKHN